MPWQARCQARPTAHAGYRRSGIPPPASSGPSGRMWRVRPRPAGQGRTGLRRTASLRPHPTREDRPPPHSVRRNRATSRGRAARIGRSRPLRAATAHTRCHGQRPWPAVPPLLSSRVGASFASSSRRCPRGVRRNCIRGMWLSELRNVSIRAARFTGAAIPTEHGRGPFTRSY